jgi:DHA3 family macrolide efflux protein-like MFS transporter
MSLALLALGMFLLLSGMLPPGGFFWFVVLAAFLGMMGSFFWLALIVHVQTTISPGVMGRVIALITSLMSLAIPFGLFLAAPFAETMGITVWFVVSGVAIMAAGLLGLGLSRIPVAAAEKNAD